jgi:oxygen-dependent protoporphyrinogen oxidase
METLPRRLAERLVDRGVRFVRAAATTVAPLPGGRWRIALGSPARGTGFPTAGSAAVPTSFPAVIEADAVVVAVPSAAAARLVDGCDRGLASELGAIEYAGAGIVSLGFSRSDVARPLDAAGLVVPRREGRRILAVSFSSQKFPGRAPEGGILMRTFVGGALDPEATALDDAALVRLVRAELHGLLGVRGEPLITQVDRWHDAMPQYHLGHADRVARIAALVAAHHGLGIAGAAYEGVGIPQVIASGRKAAVAAMRGTGLATRP